MKFNELWLRDWVKPALNRPELAEQITLAGLEVDGIEPVAGKFSGVVIGYVVECQQHPNADKLRITKVDVGQDKLLNIVCGAPNCRQGLKVACATVGAELPGNFKIKPAKLRGEPSEGMLCSFTELGIPSDLNGIIELPEDAPIGNDLRDYLLLDDVTIEIGLTPNRADCLSIRGIARDVAVLNDLPLNEPEILSVTPSIENRFNIVTEAKEACPRYVGRVIKNIDLSAPTPLYIKERLRRCGIRSIDIIVDVTNYVLLELGQPMHAFDLNKVNEKIIVRFAHKNESLTLLDGNDIKLDDDVLVIADNEKVLGMAGIFGGLDSSVTAETKHIFLESAYFAPLAITGRARRYGLHTDASHRFERGVDPELQVTAMERATALILAYCGGEAGPITHIENTDLLPSRTNVKLTRVKLDKLLGYQIDSLRVTSILEKLGCKVSCGEEIWMVESPSWRFDIAIEEDLIEEVARIYGYNNIPNTPINTNLVTTAISETELTLQRVKMLLVDQGYQEAITYSFVDPKIQRLIHPTQTELMLPNPISVEMSAMRVSLWTGLLDAVIYNQNRQQNRVRIFESGLRFIPDENATLGVRQEMMIAGVIAGNKFDDHWAFPKKAVDFFDLKGDVEAILALTGKLDDIEFTAEAHPALHPGQSAGIYLNQKLIGYIGVIHPQLENELGLNNKTIVFEIQWDTIKERLVPNAEDISRFPANRRDISIVVAEQVSTKDIIRECKKVGGELLVEVKLFDVYRGQGVKDGYKSLAIALTLQDKSRTLEEVEIAKVVNICVEALEVRFQALLRE